MRSRTSSCSFSLRSASTPLSSTTRQLSARPSRIFSTVSDEVLGLDLKGLRQPFACRRVRPGPLSGLDRRDRRPPDVGELRQLHLCQAPTLPVLPKTRQFHRRIVPHYHCILPQKVRQ